MGAGEIFGFLGPNGAGKTTTIRVLLGLLRADGGAARVLGRDCWRESAVIKRDVGYVAGDVRLWRWMTAESALATVGRVRGMDLMGRGLGLCERLGLERGVRVRAMSRGMRQKLALVMALAHGPRVVVLDEPTSGLDPIVQEELARLLREMAAGGSAVFFSSHTLGEVERLCDRVAIVRGGRIVADETIARLRERAHRVVTLWMEGGVELPRILREERREEVEDGVRVWCELTGSARELAGWVAGEGRVRDYEVSAPDLERLFRGFYSEGGGGGGGS